MTDETPKQEPTDEPHDDERYPVDRLKERVAERVGRRTKGRPLMAYLVLFAAAATLLLLLGVVWISSRGGGPGDALICTEISPDDAQTAILSGGVREIKILVDRDRPLEGLTGVVLELRSDVCRQTPQGAGIRNDLYRVIGTVELYNTFAEEPIQVQYQRQEIAVELLWTQTPTPSPTVEPTMTATPPAETPTETPADPTATTEVSTPEADAEASPAAESSTGTTTADGDATSQP